MNAPLQVAPVYRDRWKHFVQHLLEQLARMSRSNFAIFRTDHSRTREYVLHSYAPMESERQNPPLLDEEFEIPIKKGKKCWEKVKPGVTWGAMTYTHPDDHPEDASDYSPGELKFIYWVGQKAWFPISLGGRDEGLIVLVRGTKNVPYDRAAVLELWVAAQEYISGGVSGADHAGFVAALAAMNALRRCPDRETLFRALSHCVCSGAGLGWNRMWVWEQEADRPATYRCRTALGEVNEARWRAATATLSNRSVDLLAEIASVDPDPASVADQLYRSCRDALAEIPPELADRLFAADSKSRIACAALVGGFADEFAPVERAFREAIGRAVQATGVDRYDAGTLRVLPLVIRGNRILVLLEHPYAKPAEPSAVLATAFLQHAGTVVREWEIGAAGQVEED